MTEVIYIHGHQPSPTGNGANHRVYQIVHDLIEIFGESRVHLLKLAPDIRYNRSSIYKTSRINTYFDEIVNRLRLAKKIIQYSANPHHVLGYLAEANLQNCPYGSVPLGEYKALLKQCFGTPVCIVDHPGHHQIISHNQKNGILTIYCPHNLETLDRNIYLRDKPIQRQKIIGELFCEIEALTKSQERLPISKLETDLLIGLGLRSEYYPYRPVGELFDRLVNIRKQRSNEHSGLSFFIMVGSTNHSTTKDSFQWFFNQAKQHGLPAGVRIICIGRDTDRLSEDYQIPGIELLGWVDQQTLDQLMIKAKAALIPQLMGFGALTRLPEYSCAGIPVLVSEHPIIAINEPPGIMKMSNDWSAWYKGIESIINSDNQPGPIEDYLVWDSLQNKTLHKVVNKY